MTADFPKTLRDRNARIEANRGKILKIAKAIGTGRYRDDVISDAQLALVAGVDEGLDGESLRIYVRRQLRNTIRRLWAQDNRTSDPHGPAGNPPEECGDETWDSNPQKRRLSGPDEAEVKALEVEVQHRMALRSAIAQLPDRQREASELVYLDGRSVSEAATRMCISQPAATALLKRALENIKENLEKNLVQPL